MRAAILARFAPLLLPFYAVGAADGFSQRAIRRACGGRESASLYHRVKYLQLAVLGLGGVVLLLWPRQVQWELCVLLGALLTSGLPPMQWVYYKSTSSPRAQEHLATLLRAAFPTADMPAAAIGNSRAWRSFLHEFTIMELRCTVV